MSQLLGQLYTVPGVRGAAVYDHQGTCLEYRVDPPEAGPDLAAVLDRLLVGLEAYEYLERDAMRLAWARFDQGMVAVLRTPHHRAIAITRPDINPPLLTVALGALEVKLNRLARGLRDSVPPHREGDRRAHTLDIDIDSLPSTELVPEVALNTLHDALTDRMGPVARVLIQDQFDAMGLPAFTVPRSLWPTLVESLALELPDFSERQRFVRHLLPLA